MWYILIMNKDVIYIEPEDDITDIITKIESSKEKIVALVPPKKAGVFRSVVNIKLIAKAGTTAEKNVVLVTTDPSIVKLAAATKIPVTKNLQSAPAIPKAESLAEEGTVKEELVEESDGTIETKEDVEELESSKDEDENDDEEEAENKKDEEKSKKTKERTEKAKKELKKTGNKFVDWFKEHKKLAIFGCMGIVLLILVLIWALVLAPAATITVGIRTTANNFSENVTFTTKLEEENAGEGRFYLEEKKNESSEKVEFEATGTKNTGEKASGEINVYAYFPLNVKSSVQISEGEAFTISGLTFRATSGTTLSYSGEGKNECANKDNADGLVDYGCRINGVIPVVASEAGAKYNISPSSTGWDTNARVFAYSEKAMSGGSDKMITIVTQADVDKAKASLEVSNETENKEKLFEEINEKSEDAFIIQSSFTQSSSEAKSVPAVGEEVKEGEKPTLTATTTASVFVIDKTKVKEFITEKAKLSDSQKIYEIKDPFIENFMKTDNGYTGKLKTSYITGPKITESDVVELVKGRGLGDAQHSLRDIDGVSSVRIDASFPWVTSIPNDTNKITVILEVKE